MMRYKKWYEETLNKEITKHQLEVEIIKSGCKKNYTKGLYINNKFNLYKVKIFII